MTTATRTEVGTCKMGDVFIFERSSSSGQTWMVRAGNHTIGTYDTQAQAEGVVRALVGDAALNDAAIEAIGQEKFTEELPVTPEPVKAKK